MGALLSQVLPLAAGAAISPAVLTVQLLTLAKGGAALRRSWLIALGAGIVLAIDGVLALSLAASTGGSGTTPEWKSAVKLVAAVALLVVGVRTLRRPPKPPKEEDAPARGTGAGKALGLGMLLMATNVTTLALFFPAVHQVSTAGDVELDGQIVAFAAVFAITMLPAVAPPLLVSVLGERGQRGLVKLNDFVTAHHQQINAAVCFLFALVLGVPAVRELA